MNVSDDATLRSLYARLVTDRRQRAASATVPVETVQALADGTYAGADRVALLDQVLADPGMHAELRLFLDLAGEAPPRARFRFSRLTTSLALAASAVIAVALGSRLVTGGADEGPLRGAGGGVPIVAPGATAASGTVTFTWRRVPGATAYDLEVTSDDGAAVVTRSTADTTVQAELAVTNGASLRWWVTARREDGTSARSAVQRLALRPR